MKYVLILSIALFAASCRDSATSTPAPIPRCLTVYSGGKEIGSYKGQRAHHVYNDGSMEFIDLRLGEVTVRGDWTLQSCP